MAEDDLFLSRMRSLGVQPLQETRRRKEPVAPEPDTLFETDVELSESDLFFEAMGDLGLSVPEKSSQTLHPQEHRTTMASLEAQQRSEEQQEQNPVVQSPWHSKRVVESEEDRDRLLFLETIENLPTPDKDSTAAPESNLVVRKLKAPRNTVVEPDDTLDLHRLRVQEALASLRSFIARSRRSRYNLVLIITGKGHHSQDGVPVLKREVEAWIRGKEGKGAVQAFSEAAPSQGGRGALLVHLRRDSSKHP